MEQKNKIIEDYIINISKQVNSQYNGLIDDDKISKAIEMFKDSSDDLETEIIPKINELVQEVIDNYLKLKEKEHEKIMLKNIEKNINSGFFIDMLKRNWNKTHNIYSLGNLIGELYTLHIINKDGYGFEYYMTKIETLYSQYGERKISPEQFELQKAKLISYVIATKFGININQEITQEDMLRVKNYFLQEYVSNGYVSHSFPEAYYESIMKNGLISSTDQRKDKPLEVQEIQDIFMNKGVVSPMGGYPFYGGSGIYYEHDFTKVFQHAIDSPEWFNWFTSSDHMTTYHSDVETFPYILRSEKDCRRNIDDLCKNARLSEEETKKVVDFYQKQYSKFSSPKLNVALISKKTLGKDDVLKAAPQNMDLFSTITYILKDGARQYTEHSDNVYIGTIPPDKLNVSVIPDASNYVNVNQYHRETQEHLISLENNLTVLQTAEENKSRLVPSMVPKVEKSKQEILSKKKLFVQQSSIQSKNSTPFISKKNSFDKRSQGELQIANQIKQKNKIIRQKKEQKRQMNKSKVKTLTSSSSQSKGFANTLVLSLIASFVVGALFMVVYTIIGK